jgi:hypothetical protein
MNKAKKPNDSEYVRKYIPVSARRNRPTGLWDVKDPTLSR